MRNCSHWLKLLSNQLLNQAVDVYILKKRKCEIYIDTYDSTRDINLPTYVNGRNLRDFADRISLSS